MLMAAAFAGALLLAACGSSSPGTGTAAAAGGRDPALQFAKCMRSHGVTNFPDPGAGGSIQIGPDSGINARSPAFQAAQKACARYAPITGAPTTMTASQRRQAVAFAKCVRAHGVPNFPDPSQTAPSGAHFVIALRGMLFAFTSAFDPRSPAFRHAASACGVPLPGS
jgi:hypothetical protein